VPDAPRQQRSACQAQVLDDAELIATWKARQEAHMPKLFAPTTGAAIAARQGVLWVRCICMSGCLRRGVVHIAAVILIIVAAVIATRPRGAACASTFALLGI
jgi:hypothetical protein